MQLYALLSCSQGLQGQNHEAIKGATIMAQWPAVEKCGNVDHLLKKARVVGMQALAEKAVDINLSQIKVLHKNGYLYKVVYSKDKYNKMVISLVNKMAGLDRTGKSIERQRRLLAEQSHCL